MLLGAINIPAAVGVAIARVTSSPKTPPSAYSPTLPPPSYLVQPARTEYVSLPQSQTQEEIPEIVVSAKRVPWYAWAALRVAVSAVLFSRK